MAGSGFLSGRAAAGAANLLAAAALTAFYLVIGSGSLDHGRRQDFLNFYTGASLAWEGRYQDLHDPAVQLARERRLAPDRTALVPFVRPHFYAAAIAPLALVPYAGAFRVWLAAQAGFLLAFLYLIGKHFGSEGVLAAAMFPAAAIGIVHGQDNLLIGLLTMAGLSAMIRGRERAGGLWWSLVLVKFHLAAGLALALIVARRWRALGAFLAGGAALAAVSLWLGGWQGAATYFHLLYTPHTEGLYPGYEMLVNLQGVAANLGLPVTAVYAAGGVGLAVLATRALLLTDWWRQFALSLGCCLLATPHVYMYDLTILVPALVLTLRSSTSRAARAFALAVLCPLTALSYLAADWLRLLLLGALLGWLWSVSQPESGPARHEKQTPARASHAC